LFASSMTVFPAPIPVGGNVDLTLEESANGEFFEITGGKVSGVADLLFPYEAIIVGRLNCTTRKLEGAALKNGHYLAYKHLHQQAQAPGNRFVVVLTDGMESCDAEKLTALNTEIPKALSVCREVKADTGAKIDIVLGCRTVVIPA
jgi:hypothetical protein